MVVNLFGVINVWAATTNPVNFTSMQSIPLSCFDEDPYTRANRTTGMTSLRAPGAFAGFSGNYTTTNPTRVIGGPNNRASDDAYFRMAAAGTSEVTAEVLDAGGTSSNYNYYAAPTNGDKVTFSIDVLLESDYTGSYNRAIQVGAWVRDTASTVFSNLVSFKSGNMTFAGSGDYIPTATPYVADTWYNLVFEFDLDVNKYKVYVDGVDKGTGRIAGENGATAGTPQHIDSDAPRGIRILRADMSNLVASVICLDNMAVYRSEPFVVERYKVNKDAASLSLADDMLDGNADKDNVITDLYLPIELDEGSTVTWNSSSPAIAVNNETGIGTVTRQPVDTTVTLTANLKNAGETDERTAVKTFTVTVPRIINDVTTDVDALTAQTILGSNTALDSITTNLTLPTVGASGNTTITWTTTDGNAVSTTGVVTRGGNNKTTTLTATVSKQGEQSGTKDFALTVSYDPALVDKTALQALVTAGNNLNSENYTTASYEAFTPILSAAIDIINTDHNQDEVDTAKLNLQNAIGNLTFIDGVVKNSAGFVTKDTFVKNTTVEVHGSDTTIVAKHPVSAPKDSTTRRIYMGFDITNINPYSNKVYLKLYVSQLGANENYPNDSISIHSVGNNWSESNTYAQMPTDFSTSLASFGPMCIHPLKADYDTVKGYKTFDVTNYVMAQKALGAQEISFAAGSLSDITGSSYIAIDSKEGANPPLLEAEEYPTIKNSAGDDLEAIALPEIVSKPKTIILPTTGVINGHTISWSSSNPVLIATSGEVTTIPALPEVVEVTASITSMGITYSKTFEITIGEGQLVLNGLQFVDSEGVKMTSLNSAQYIGGKVYVSSNSFDTQEVMLILALYKDNKLMYMASQQRTYENDTADYLSVGMDVSQVDLTDYTAQLFVWNNYNHMIPLCKPEQIQ